MNVDPCKCIMRLVDKHFISAVTDKICTFADGIFIEFFDAVHVIRECAFKDRISVHTEVCRLFCKVLDYLEASGIKCCLSREIFAYAECSLSPSFNTAVHACDSLSDPCYNRFIL